MPEYVVGDCGGGGGGSAAVVVNSFPHPIDCTLRVLHLVGDGQPRHQENTKIARKRNQSING
ncbi:hypothetical protein DERF_009880 [Dermatophagoides farinae]|uniref:Uncharacterized protein n=1 Tax=Dermatophagoides farinae TaxID=6954 RepID=A0A922L678_DERFA|nr:hypothetical protein DERF_009880 [Dermatophagoides farinae]